MALDSPHKTLYNVCVTNYITFMAREMNYTYLRSNLKEAFDEVCTTREPLYVKRQRHKGVVIISMDDWNAMQETFYLLKNPANAKRLIKSAASDGKSNIKTSVKALRDEFRITS